MYYVHMDQSNKVLLPDEVAKILGVHRITIKRYMESKVNPLPHIKLGHKTIRIIRGQLDEWLKNRSIR